MSKRDDGLSRQNLLLNNVHGVRCGSDDDQSPAVSSQEPTREIAAARMASSPCSCQKLDVEGTIGKAALHESSFSIVNFEEYPMPPPNLAIDVISISALNDRHRYVAKQRDRPQQSGIAGFGCTADRRRLGNHSWICNSDGQKTVALAKRTDQG